MTLWEGNLGIRDCFISYVSSNPSFSFERICGGRILDALTHNTEYPIIFYKVSRYRVRTISIRGYLDIYNIMIKLCKALSLHIKLLYMHCTVDSHLQLPWQSKDKWFCCSYGALASNISHPWEICITDKGISSPVFPCLLVSVMQWYAMIKTNLSQVHDTLYIFGS